MAKEYAKRGETIDLMLDDLNTGVIRIHDRDFNKRFAISINNNVNQHTLSLDVRTYDADKAEAVAQNLAVAVSFNKSEERNG